MKIHDLIALLNDMQERKGDLEVMVMVDKTGPRTLYSGIDKVVFADGLRPTIVIIPFGVIQR